MIISERLLPILEQLQEAFEAQIAHLQSSAGIHLEDWGIQTFAVNPAPRLLCKAQSVPKGLHFFAELKDLFTTH
jgi:hypothetical protein